MSFRRLRTRIIVFFVALLATVQLAALVLVNNANTHNARAKTDAEFAVGQRVFEQLLTQNRERLIIAARVLAADYGFREAIISRDMETILSVLENHGSRIGADTMSLVSLQNTVVADTQSTTAVDRPYPFGKLIDAAKRDGSASSIELINRRAYQIVMVPVLAPLPIAWVAMGFVIDDALADNLRELTTLQISFLQAETANGPWQLLATTLNDADRQQLTRQLPELDLALQLHELTLNRTVHGVRMFVLGQHDGTLVVAVLQRSLAEAFAAFSNLQTTLLMLGIAGLLVSIFFSAAIAMGITKPISELVSAARRIAKGDYATEVEVNRVDEIGLLAQSLDTMRGGIAEREQEILRLAYEDTLTGLPNRALFNERLQQAILNARRSGDTVSILMMDIDRFKFINDSLGHVVGDHVLRETGKRLQKTLRDSDTIARLGGDEFAILLTTSGAEQVLNVVHKVVRELEQPVSYQEQPVDVRVSIGIASFPEHGEQSGQLLRNADIAMYVAKRNKTGFATYDANYDTHQEQHLSMLGELRRAVERNELRVFYQPKLNLSTGRIDAVEALLRWDHPTRGFVSPGEFIPFAEHTGYIKILTRWVLAAALRQCGQWLAQGIRLRVSVNISARDLMSRDLPELVTHCMQANQVPADLVCLEITESGFMEDPAHAQQVLLKLHALGIHLSIDDYGTGFSSLSYVVKLPVDEIKIDRSFVMNIASDDSTLIIVRSTVELGHNLGMTVVAEGVEDQEGLEILRRLGCDQAQGYFISKPVAAEQLEKWLATRQPGAMSAAPREQELSVMALLPVSQAG